MDLLTECYASLSLDGALSEDEEVSACVLHDLANYNIDVGLDVNEFKCVLAERFFAHPFIIRINEIIKS